LASFVNVANLNSHDLLHLYQAGQSDAATAIFDRYVARLIALARSRIGPKLKRRIDAEDVVQSAYRSFFVHAKKNEYQLAESGDLWRLIASITLNKLYSQVEKQTAAKRSIDREESADSVAYNAISPEPTAAEVVAVLEQLHLATKGLSADELFAITASLQGQSVAEISVSLKKSDRTIRRLLAEGRQKIEQQLLAGNESIPLPTILEVKQQSALQYSDFILEKLLGSGGMGKVFRARDKGKGKTVAIKALHKSRLSDKRAVSQFVQEAQILTKLRHPNIVGVQGLGQFPSGGYFFVMDYIDGKDLQSRMAGKPMPLKEVVAIVKQVANAIGYAHKNGIVHCDLKPANILLDRNGQVFVTDFGFAYLIAGSSANNIGGTTGYMAPEIRCLHSQPTPAADIYGIGVLLWVLATGKVPDHLFDLNTETGDLTPISAICKQCLTEDPDKRYTDMFCLIQDLETISVV